LNRTICDVPGFAVGCAEDKEKLTGVTVIRCPEGTVGGIDLRGSATSTRQCDSLQAHHLVGEVHALCFAGGSAFGLDCAAGVMRCLSEEEIGLNVGFRIVPVVPTAVIFDCALGVHDAFPTADMAYEACQFADREVPVGSVGAGCGASVGKVYGIGQAMKGGQGTHSVAGADGLIVAALSVVNAYGDIVDPATGRIIAGARSETDDNEFADAVQVLAGGQKPASSFSKGPQNTVLTAIAANARMDKGALCRIAKMGHEGLARIVRPCHAAFDGDVAVALSAGTINADENAVGALAAEAVAGAVLNAMRSADGFGIIPDCKTFPSPGSRT
jgi:L-aminopeptidase/D-esterase-like protein